MKKNTMRAIIVDPRAEDGFAFAEVPAPGASPGRVIVQVHHVSLNRGDLNDARSGRIAPGAVLGSDLAGVVVAPALDVRGPAVGARVVGLAAGAFAELVAVDVDAIAEVPPTVDLASAAALPVAGIAALRALRVAGSVLGRRVLVTGASGGVGRFAVALAARAGARVVAAVGSDEHGEGLRSLGASEIVVDLSDMAGPVDIVLDNVGGPQLVQAWDLLAPGGTLVSIGWASGQPATFQPYATVAPGKRIVSLLIEGPFATDLAALVAFVAEGSLPVPIGWRGRWDQIHEATAALRARQIRGKVVMDVQTQD